MRLAVGDVLGGDDGGEGAVQPERVDDRLGVGARSRAGDRLPPTGAVEPAQPGQRAGERTDAVRGDQRAVVRLLLVADAGDVGVADRRIDQRSQDGVVALAEGGVELGAGEIAAELAHVSRQAAKWRSPESTSVPSMSHRTARGAARVT